MRKSVLPGTDLKIISRETDSTAAAKHERSFGKNTFSTTKKFRKIANFATAKSPLQALQNQQNFGQNHLAKTVSAKNFAEISLMKQKTSYFSCLVAKTASSVSSPFSSFKTIALEQVFSGRLITLRVEMISLKSRDQSFGLEIFLEASNKKILGNPTKT